MASKMVAGKQIQIDDLGFFTDPNDWTRDMVVELAQAEGMQELTELHWQIIDYCRQEGLASGRAPSLRAIVAATGVQMKELFNLFPKSPDKKIARITGLRMAARCI